MKQQPDNLITNKLELEELKLLVNEPGHSSKNMLEHKKNQNSQSSKECVGTQRGFKLLDRKADILIRIIKTNR